MNLRDPKSLKKLKLFTLGMTAVFFLTFIYLEFFTHASNIYMVIGKQVCMLLTFMFPLVYRIIAKDKELGYYIFFTCIWVILIGFRTLDDIRNYYQSVAHIQFGKAFNQQRRGMSVAIIPTDWHVQLSLGSETNWKGKSNVIGHADKSVFIDSAYEDAFESDSYNLKPLRGASRSIIVGRVINKGKGADTDSYSYDYDNISHAITRRQADSIFAVEKVEKDY